MNEAASSARAQGPRPLRGPAGAAIYPAGIGHLLVAKSILFAAPLALAVLWTPATYAAAEASYAVGLFVASICIGPLLHSISHQYVLDLDTQNWDQALAAGWLLCAVALLVAAVLLWYEASDLAVLVAVMTCLVGWQLIAATIFRVRASVYTPWVEGLVFPFLVVLAVLLPAFSAADLIVAIGLIGVATGLVASVLLIRIRKPGLVRRAWRATKSGIPLTVFGLVTSWAGVGGRILIGTFSFAELPMYAVAFRICGLAAGFYMVVTTVLWARLYRAAVPQADRLLANMLALIGILELLVSLFGGLAIKQLDVFGMPRPSSALTGIVPIVAIESFFWAALSMLQPLVARNELANQAIAPFGFVAITSTMMIIVAIFSGAPLEPICWLLAAQSAALFWLGLRALTSKDSYPRTMVIALCSGGALTVTALWGAF